METFVAVLAALIVERQLRNLYHFMADYGYHHGRRGEALRWKVRGAVRPMLGWRR